MRVKIWRCAVMLILTFAVCRSVYGQVGDMGFFGGITEGKRLPNTNETLLRQSETNKHKNQIDTYIYKELIFLSGQPLEFEGMIEVTQIGNPELDLGQYTKSYRVFASPATAEDIRLERLLEFNVNYRRENHQIISNYQVMRWTETIAANGITYTLNPRGSDFLLSVIEDRAVGVNYYRGDISRRAVFTSDGESGAIIEASDTFYGYDCVWSSSETHRVDETVATGDWQMQLQLRPNVTVRKTMEYTPNEPSAISFKGNYKDVYQNDSGLRYDILIKPRIAADIPSTGQISIVTRNTFEQLIAPDLDYLKGHAAEEDIRRLFSMQILTGDPKHYKPNQAITRGQYVTALTRAIKLPVEAPVIKRTSRKLSQPPIVFSDVPPQRLEYPNIMAAYRGDLAIGRDNGSFYFDAILTRQEAIAILIRALGFVHTAPDPTPLTLCSDGYDIADWARREMAAAFRMRFVVPDAQGRIKPSAPVSKAEAAALLNRMVDYMRTEIATDYADHIINYTE
jgi:hypothetical protein